MARPVRRRRTRACGDVDSHAVGIATNDPPAAPYFSRCALQAQSVASPFRLRYVLSAAITWLQGSWHKPANWVPLAGRNRVALTALLETNKNGVILPRVYTPSSSSASAGPTDRSFSKCRFLHKNQPFFCHRLTPCVVRIVCKSQSEVPNLTLLPTSRSANRLPLLRSPLDT